MQFNNLLEKSSSYLNTLCLEIQDRCVGSEGNRTATNFFADTLEAFGFKIETHSFDCMDWSTYGAELSTNRSNFEVHPSPYTLGCHLSLPFVAVSTVEELKAAHVSNKIILLHGEIAAEQLMPKNFPFYNPDSHKQIIEMLESKSPAAIITATTRNPEIAGAVYPFPLIEDGDFDIPSVYMTAEEGERLLEYEGQEVLLDINAQRTSARGWNVVGTHGQIKQNRIVLFAHIDAKKGTPGALDNGTGIAVLLLLAELLSEFSLPFTTELVAINGEDYYSAPGEQEYLKSNEGKFNEISLGINMDGVGYHRGETAFSLYNCPSGLDDAVQPIFGEYNIIGGNPWYQGDHSLFLMHQRPALALTSEHLSEILNEIVHTPKDTPDIVDPTKLVNLASALRDLLTRIDG